MVKQARFGQPAVYNATPPALVDGDPSALNVDASGNLKVAGSATDGGAASGTSQQIAGVYNVATPTYTDGKTATLQTDAQGRLKVTTAPLSSTVDQVSVQGIVSEQASLSTASTTNNDLVPFVDVSNYKSGTIQLSGTWTGTVRIQGSNDNSTFNTILATSIGSSNSGLQADLTANGHYVFQILHKFIRIRVTTGGTGTVAGTLELFTLPHSPQMVNTSVTATPTVNTVSVATTSTSVLAANASRKAVIFSNVGAQNIYLNLAGGTAVATNFLVLPNTSWVWDRWVTTTAITGIAATSATSLSVTEMT